MCRDPWFLKFTKTYIICGSNRNPCIPKFDKRPRFWNLFCRIWSQNQDLGLKLAASILTRRGASIGTHSDPQFPPDLTQNGFRILGVGPQISLWCCLISSLNSGFYSHYLMRSEVLNASPCDRLYVTCTPEALGNLSERQSTQGLSIPVWL